MEKFWLKVKTAITGAYDERCRYNVIVILQIQAKRKMLGGWEMFYDA